MRNTLPQENVGIFFIRCKDDMVMNNVFAPESNHYRLEDVPRPVTIKIYASW